MLVKVVYCCHCGSDDLRKDGKASRDRQRYACRSCGRRSREQACAVGYSEVERETILRSYQERSSLRGLTRTFGVARNTVSAWLKKK
jgi:transposase-like protein